MHRAVLATNAQKQRLLSGHRSSDCTDASCLQLHARPEFSARRTACASLDLFVSRAHRQQHPNCTLLAIAAGLWSGALRF